MSEKELKEKAENWIESLKTTKGMFKKAVERYFSGSFSADEISKGSLISQDSAMLTCIQDGITLIMEAVTEENKEIAKTILSENKEAITDLKTPRPKYKELLDKDQREKLSSIVKELRRQEDFVMGLLK